VAIHPDIDGLYAEVNAYLHEINVGEDGEHLWDNYQHVTSVLLRLTEIHNDLALMEIMGEASSESRKFRTMIIDPTIERLTDVSRFESRKMTGKQIEWDMSKNG
jgi:hypothetical protein